MSSNQDTNGVSPDDRPLVIDQDRNELLGEIAAQLDALNNTLAVLLDAESDKSTPQNGSSQSPDPQPSEDPTDPLGILKDHMESHSVETPKVDFGNIPDKEVVAFEEDFAAMTDDEVQAFRDYTRNHDWVEVADWQNMGDDDDPQWVPDGFEVSYGSLEAVSDG